MFWLFAALHRADTVEGVLGVHPAFTSAQDVHILGTPVVLQRYGVTSKSRKALSKCNAIALGSDSAERWYDNRPIKFGQKV